MNFAYASPYVPPPLPVPAWGGMEVSWIGWDGSIWGLNAFGSGVQLESAGVEGLSMPSYTQWVQSSPSIAGQIFRGAIEDPRKVFWPLFLYSDVNTQAWIDLDRAFWASMHAEKYGQWKITQPSGESRTLACRFVDDGSHAYELDPFKVGWTLYGMTLMADKPFWTGPPVTAAWKASVALGMFAGPGVINIASGSTFANANLSNPGDVDAWPVWTIIGDSTTASVGVGTSQIQVPFTISDGKAVVIDTDPTVQTALYGDWVDGALVSPVDRTPDLGDANFSMIPAGADRPLNISLTGGGQIQVSLTPRFRKAW